MEELEEFTALTLGAMSDKELELWAALSDFERKTIAAAGYFLADNLREINRLNAIAKIA